MANPSHSSPRRRSIFYESGLFDPVDAPSSTETSRASANGAFLKHRVQSVRLRTRGDVREVEEEHDENESNAIPTSSLSHESSSSHSSQPQLNVPDSPRPHGSRSMMYRYAGASLLLLAASAALSQGRSTSEPLAGIPIQGVSGDEMAGGGSLRRVVLEERAASPTSACFRWAQQSSLVNGTLYLYGGQAQTEAGQTQNTWNNDFLTLDLTTTWPIDSPPLTGLPQPSGPPAVSLGYLWNSYESLYLYGGEVSWQPIVEPPPFSLWEYSIPAQSWIEHSDPVTSSGVNAPDGNVPVQRAAEGAGVVVPNLGRGYYFGGHEDAYTNPGWANYIPRVYLQSLLEFTFPGYSNDQVDALASGQDAGSAGVFRNITVGGLQAEAGFTARADGLLIYVPDFGRQGILLSLAGGTNESFTQMNEINIYDIATSSFWTQSTSGETPSVRVNPCAVVAAAADGSSYNIYMFGGQNLIPYGDQTQFSDMWILTIPAFRWIQVPQDDQSVPYGRSGATCNVWDAQMVMVGGYLGPNSNLTCESPDIYVFDLSSVEWVQQFTATSPGSGSGASVDLTPQPADFQSNGSSNPLNQQPAQIPNGLQGSYGYKVPQIIIDVVGGDASGGATVTKPIVTAAGGPLTGSGQTYTVTTPAPTTYTTTNSAGSSITRVSTPTPTANAVTSSSASSSSDSHNIAAIAIGVVCGVLLLLIAYLSFCLYLYRRQLQLYKNHVELAQQQARSGDKFAGGVPAYYGNDIAAVPPSQAASGRSGGRGEYMSRLESGSSQAAVGGGSTGGASSADKGSGAGGEGYASLLPPRSSTSSTEDLLSGQEPTFVGVMLNPRKTLRVINHD